MRASYCGPPWTAFWEFCAGGPDLYDRRSPPREERKRATKGGFSQAAESMTVENEPVTYGYDRRPQCLSTGTRGSFK